MNADEETNAEENMHTFIFPYESTGENEYIPFSNFEVLGNDSYEEKICSQ
jgi:hypothetical protein